MAVDWAAWSAAKLAAWLDANWADLMAASKVPLKAVPKAANWVEQWADPTALNLVGQLAAC